MIFTQLNGRLGNQMFQYAIARGLAARHGTSVALDPRYALKRGDGVLTRVFDLDVEANPTLPPAKHENLIGYALWRHLGLAPKRIQERELRYYPEFETWPDNVYLRGYWQSEKYFAAIADRIREDFTFPEFSNSQNAEMADRISRSMAISLHVRRGDYVDLNAHGLCDAAYYTNALSRILEDVSGEPTVFVFSDEPEWAKVNLPLPCEKVVVDFNGSDTDFEDMRLMSLCRHNIVANSSFSWWAAWLNNHAEKRVMAPSQWLADPALQITDNIPDGWTQIEVGLNR
ncbi:alpha-1,2-fucosyltransferase [Aestuariivita boseongensis]|uniref:alpha-1,2-fucosyltransferase n=1 Tax=Aestuariivita boseongensis TaxID=1470562 RepID=UPI0006834D57|nr:alpha-1,2-fucosyltransferase [Aestuariivita boseongensis]